MSKVINDKGIKPGCIYRITLENFVTYKEVELYPGPSLNMIIGPNGTGKSTFVCAIILGLGGKTSVIGRAKKISEYIRSGCQQATIEIELYQQPGQRNVIITRSFNLKDASTWSIDHKTAREKQVMELIAKMNIQVDNLCQLLPQDRVQDFSKMDPQQLLRSTLAAVGGQESVAQLDELIECRNEQRTASTRLQSNAQNLEEQIRLNERLKIQIDAMRERQEIEEKIEICEKKKLWLEYQELREKVMDLSQDKKKAEKVVKTHKDKMEPLEREIQQAKSGISKLEQQKLNAVREEHTLKEKVKEHIDSVRTQEYNIKDAESSYQDKLERHRNRERELVEARAKLDKLVTDQTRLVEKVGDESQIKMELAEVQKPIARTNALIDTLKKQKMEIQYDLEHNIAPQIRLYENKIRNLQDVDQKRLDTLRAYSEDAYQAVRWLRDHRDLFQHTVYEPMMLEINFTDPKFARYLESTVPARDLVAFTFESSEDMNLFLRRTRQEAGLRQVNAICSQGGRLNVPKGNIQQISYLGFYTYLIDTISAPDPILKYLCRQYNIHKIPIGNDHTYNNSGKVPANISYFFTENHRFVVRVSAYSGAKSSSTIEIRAPRLLANSVDTDQLDNFNRQLENFSQSAEARRAKLQETDSKLARLETDLEALHTRRKRTTEGVEKVRTLQVQIRLQKKKVRDIETEPAFDIEKEKLICRRKQRDCVLKQLKLHSDLKELMETLQRKISHGKLCKAKLDISRSGIVQRESELRELRSELQNVQTTLDNIEALLNRAKSNAKEKLIAAKRSCDNKLPNDPDFPYKGAFETIPNDHDSLQAFCIELQTRLACMDPGDHTIIREYEEREKTIASLRAAVADTSDSHKRLADKIAALRSEWLPPLEQLVRDIDRQFGRMFAKLECAGEVKLDTAAGEDEFDKYGISILVRFRASEQLCQLTRHSQSGGERALATGLYLMALQRLTTVPFRCVDEINQGMDPINERKMFQLLVKVTTELDQAQYFLLTPKLLSNLEYNPHIMVHTIMNGKNIINYRKWKYSDFIERAAAYSQ